MLSSLHAQCLSSRRSTCTSHMCSEHGSGASSPTLGPQHMSHSPAHERMPAEACTAKHSRPAPHCTGSARLPAVHSSQRSSHGCTSRLAAASDAGVTSVTAPRCWPARRSPGSAAHDDSSSRPAHFIMCISAKPSYLATASDFWQHSGAAGEPGRARACR